MSVTLVFRPAWLRLAALACAGSLMSCAAPTDRPARPSPAYEDTVRAFYQGLAALDVGLLEDAEISFQRAAALSPDEPPYAPISRSRTSALGTTRRLR